MHVRARREEIDEDLAGRRGRDLLPAHPARQPVGRARRRAKTQHVRAQVGVADRAGHDDRRGVAVTVLRAHRAPLAALVPEVPAARAGQVPLPDHALDRLAVGGQLFQRHVVEPHLARPDVLHQQQRLAHDDRRIVDAERRALVARPGAVAGRQLRTRVRARLLVEQEPFDLGARVGVADVLGRERHPARALVGEVERLVEVELVDGVRIGDPEKAALVVLGPVARDGVQSLDEQHVLAVDGADRGGDAAGQVVPLARPLRDDRLVEQVVAGDRRLAFAVLRDRRPERDQALLRLGAIPERLAVAHRLEAAGRDVHVQDQVNAVTLRPRDVVVQPLPAVVEVLARGRVGLERPIVHVKADGVHSHRGDALVVGLVVVPPRQAHVGPDVVSERDPAQQDGPPLAIDDLGTPHAQHRCGGRLRAAGARQNVSKK